MRSLLLRLVPLALIALLPGAVHFAHAKPRQIHAELAPLPSQGIAILPSTTDSAITSFDVPHFIFVEPRIVMDHRPELSPDRHELLLWLPGTQPPGSRGEGRGGAVAFCELAAKLGYHVIVLKYPNDESASVCQRDSDPAAFEKFRLAIIAGGASPHITVLRADSIENRLLKLLLHLKTSRAAEHWEEFLTPDGAIRWEAIAIAGQSQGGGHAALIALKHHVSRVICTGAPKDYSVALRQPAAWLTQESATPRDRFFAFNHQQDHQACSPEQQLENLRALKLDAFGPPIDVDHATPPYAHTRVLTTNYPGTKLKSQEAHTSVMSPRNAAVFRNVWTYLLTEPVAP